jgi:hypothetical protein
MTQSERAAKREIERLYAEDPETVEAVLGFVAVASPLAGPIRQLAEIQSVIDSRKKVSQPK